VVAFQRLLRFSQKRLSFKEYLGFQEGEVECQTILRFYPRVARYKEYSFVLHNTGLTSGT